MIISTQYLYEDYLFNWSLGYLPKLQKSVSSLEMKLLRFYSSDLGGGNSLMVFIFFRCLIYNDIKSVMLLIFFALQIFICYSAKLFHAAARPSWVSPDIHSYKCYAEYGSPSGHTSVDTHFTTYLLLAYVLEVGKQKHLVSN